MEVEIDDVLCVLRWQVPVAHCFGPPGHYKRKFCTVCRKSLESLAFRCEGNINPTYSICVSPSNLVSLHCIPQVLKKFLVHLLSVHWLWKVYFKLRSNKLTTFNKPQTLSNLYTLSSFLQFTLSESVGVCNESCLRWAKNEELLWWKKNLRCWSNLFLFPVETFDTENHQVYISRKECRIYCVTSLRYQLLIMRMKYLQWKDIWKYYLSK